MNSGLLRRLAAALEPVLLGLTTLVAAAAFGPLYDDLRWLPVIGAAVLLGTALGVARRRLGPLTLPVAVLAPLVLVVYGCYWHTTSNGLPGLATLRALGTGLTSGWARTLTAAPPVDPVGDLLVTQTVLAYLAALATVLLAGRSERISGLLVPPVLLYVAALLVTAPDAAPRLLHAGLLLVALLLVVLLRGNRSAGGTWGGMSEPDAGAVGIDLAGQRRRSAVGRIAFGLPAVAAVAALALLATNLQPLVDGTGRFDPRAHYERPFRTAPALSPLVRVKPQLETAPATALFTVRATASDPAYPLDRVRVAALDAFDGALWTQSRDFVITGSRLPAGPALQGSVVTVDLDVEVSRLPDPFLPVAGRPVRVVGADTAFDPANGTLVSTRTAVAGYRYRLTAEARKPDASLGTAQPSQTTADLPYTQLPNAPGWLQSLTNEVTAQYPTPMTQLLGIEKYLRAQGYAVNVRPGHSYGAVYRTLLGPPEERAGFAEQYASAFALMARAKGYPARVAVGYLLRPEKRDGDLFRVDTGDVHAWPEVHLAGFGWVPFEPTNTKNPATPATPRESSAPILPEDDTPVPAEGATNEGGAANTPGAGGGAGKALRTAGWSALILLAAVIAALALIVLAKLARRRYRRSHGSTADRIVAAWRDTADRLGECGRPVPPWMTPVEAAATLPTARLAPTGPALTELALIVTGAVCAPSPPPTEAVGRAWHLAGTASRTLGRAVPLHRWVAALLSPLPLLPPRWAAALRSLRPRRPAPAPAPARTPGGDKPVVPSPPTALVRSATPGPD
ncbi:transglutaminaseTgpA domain-containing protein [Dactylosporangium sp. NPDC049525]|uniref:transglutaminase family protein n=1 Tax=Dactylosporangium sp. NPDC049525 TaxID=3154730 RepID=UPI00341A1655